MFCFKALTLNIIEDNTIEILIKILNYLIIIILGQELLGTLH